MNNIEISYYNCKFDKKYTHKSEDNKIKEEIKESLCTLPSLNIADDEFLLDDLIQKINIFKSDKKFFVVFGTGGSNLGSKAIINIFSSNENSDYKNNFIKFYDNINPVSFQKEFKNINIKETGFIIISKSGSTPETLSQFTCLLTIADQKNILDTFFRNCLIITENKPSPLKNIGIQNNCFILDHEKDIGGRFSVFSNVGMVPSIIANINIKKIYLGVNSFKKKIQSNLFDEHLRLSNFFIKNKINKVFSNNVIMTYSDSLFYFGKWYLQLWAESIGKKGQGVTPIHSIGTTDQHSQLQLYLDGPKDKFFTFITTDHKNKGITMNKKFLNEDNISYLSGKKMGDLMQAEQKATVETFKVKKFPCREIYLPNIDEYSLAQLMTLSIMETITACKLLKVDPFNQPAVEYGKKLTKDFLS